MSLYRSFNVHFKIIIGEYHVDKQILRHDVSFLFDYRLALDRRSIHCKASCTRSFFVQSYSSYNRSGRKVHEDVDGNSESTARRRVRRRCLVMEIRYKKIRRERLLWDFSGRRNGARECVRGRYNFQCKHAASGTANKSRLFCRFSSVRKISSRVDLWSTFQAIQKLLAGLSYNFSTPC